MEELTITVIILAIAIFGGLWFDSASCAAQTKDIGVYSWGPVQGCLVKPNGKDSFIPLQRAQQALREWEGT